VRRPEDEARRLIHGVRPASDGELGDAEVQQLDVSTLVVPADDEHVGRLHVTVQDALGMGNLETSQDFVGNTKRSLGGQRLLALEVLLQVLSDETLHHQVGGGTIQEACVEHLDNGSVPQGADGPGFPEEPLELFDSVHIPGVQDLERDAPP
jgi:hypothetical protein